MQKKEHARYDCCMICDRELDYVGAIDARRKEVICGYCAARLKQFGFELHPCQRSAKADFLAFLMDLKPSERWYVLEEVGYSFCCLEGAEIDKYVAELLGLKNVPLGKRIIRKWCCRDDLPYHHSCKDC